ncbi:hypothetical protein P378_01095 [Desulforamulus profundi]|uniref:Uncharacterized protein n=1 Tax=Desulforamulus profundi TaxID=1383067 RepID=A0A2C6MJ39_9FIRM|nr:hypothetical protein P378_01095 [Desulforamulus profundi]
MACKPMSDLQNKWESGSIQISPLHKVIRYIDKWRWLIHKITDKLR